MVIDPTGVKDSNPGWDVTIEHPDNKAYKENKITFVSNPRKLVIARQTTRAIDMLHDFGDFLKGLAGLVFDGLTAPAVIAAGLAAGKGKDSVDPVIDSFVSDGEKVAIAVSDFYDGIVGDSQSSSFPIDVFLTELDSNCKTGYSLTALVQAEYSSGDSKGGEYGIVYCDAVWGSGAMALDESKSDAKDAQQIPLSVTVPLTGQSGAPGSANVKVNCKIKAYAGSGFMDKAKPSSARVELKKVILTFVDACPGH